ncbi:hypothetical protein BAZOLSSOX_2002 [uncultured Gammaproteobacteria bacterium]|jgi:hypothetical protein|nr:hypothetical protein BAZOLSSOX_2002 [uncultured Gammaproteobacteria bacterium]
MQKNNITIVVAVALTLATAQSIASNDLQITRTGLNDLAVIAHSEAPTSQSVSK